MSFVYRMCCEPSAWSALTFQLKFTAKLDNYFPRSRALRVSMEMALGPWVKPRMLGPFGTRVMWWWARDGGTTRGQGRAGQVCQESWHEAELCLQTLFGRRISREEACMPFPETGLELKNSNKGRGGIEYSDLTASSEKFASGVSHHNMCVRTKPF